MSADATTRYENVKKYKCQVCRHDHLSHLTTEQWNNRSNLIIKLSKRNSKKKKIEKKI